MNEKQGEEVGLVLVGKRMKTKNYCKEKWVLITKTETNQTRGLLAIYFLT